MIHRTTCRLAAPALVVGLLFVASCGPRSDPRWSAVQTQKGPAVSKEAVPGGTLNKFFPKPEGDWDVVYTQEKTGFAQASLKKAGTEVALLAISDTVSDPAVADEYKEAKDKLDSYPLQAKGALGTAILVGDRFQVAVRTMPGGSFTEADRKDWLKKFDLTGLSSHQ